MKPDENFSASEVGALLERIESKFDTFAEALAPIPDRMLAVEERLTAVESHFMTMEDAVKIALPELFKRVTKLENKVGI